MGKLSRGYEPLTQPRTGHPDLCAVGRAYRNDFDDEDRAWFDGVMADVSQDTLHIHGWLAENGLALSVSTLGRHRRKVCCCVLSQSGV